MMWDSLPDVIKNINSSIINYNIKTLTLILKNNKIDNKFHKYFISYEYANILFNHKERSKDKLDKLIKLTQILLDYNILLLRYNVNAKDYNHRCHSRSILDQICKTSKYVTLNLNCRLSILKI